MNKSTRYLTPKVILAAACAAVVCCQPAYSLGPGAVGGNRYRIVISSDIGGSDEDDIQSMIHYLVYSDLFDTEALISSPPNAGRKADILEVIDVYAKDYPRLRTYSPKYPPPTYLRSIAKQGHTDRAPQAGYSHSTEGSDYLIQCAKKSNQRPLYVLVWGSITDIAQALHDEPGIKSKIRVHFIASWNQRNDQNAFRYIDEHHPDLWIIHNDTTFRGWYMGGEQGGDLGNRSFVASHMKNHGALGDYFAPLKGGKIKMGDTPTIAWLLRGTPEDPTKPSWGGKFIKHPDRPNWYMDDPDPGFIESGKKGAKTINKWRKDYLRHWQQRMDRCRRKSAR